MTDPSEMFDAYIDDTLSGHDRENFEMRLSSDRRFACEFRTYLLAVRRRYIIARRENIQFAVAMRNITEVKLDMITGRKGDSDVDK